MNEPAAASPSPTSQASAAATVTPSPRVAAAILWACVLAVAGGLIAGLSLEKFGMLGSLVFWGAGALGGLVSRKLTQGPNRAVAYSLVVACVVAFVVGEASWYRWNFTIPDPVTGEHRDPTWVEAFTRVPSSCGSTHRSPWRSGRSAHFSAPSRLIGKRKRFRMARREGRTEFDSTSPRERGQPHWDPPHLHQKLSLKEALRSVELQNTRRNVANGGARNDERPGQVEMLGPTIRPRVVEPLEPTFDERPKVASLTSITEAAGIREVLGYRLAAVLLADHVIYLATQVGVLFRNETVFADSPRAVRNKPAKIGGHIAGHGSRFRALAFARRMTCSTFM
jgi:hypothetical protein